MFVKHNKPLFYRLRTYITFPPGDEELGFETFKRIIALTLGRHW